MVFSLDLMLHFYMKNRRRIAIIARDRQEEALRMAIGLAILNDSVDIYIIDKELQETEKNTMNLEMIEAMRIKIFTNLKEKSGISYLSTEEIAKKILEYDHVIPY